MIVLDASVVIDLLARSEDAGAIEERVSGKRLAAPALLHFEVASFLRRAVMLGRMSAERAGGVAVDLLALPLLRWEATASMLHRVVELRDVVSAYDGAYVALAEHLDCTLYTRDRRLATARGHAAHVQLL